MNPGLHTHAAADVLPVLSVTAVVPHDVQAVAPVRSEYVPRTHGENGPPGCPLYPTFAVQAVITVLAAGEFEFGGHGAKELLPGVP